jgi:hypothetical protein
LTKGVEMQQEFLHIAATPDEGYPLRILQAYRRLGDYKWSDSSNGVSENNVLVKTMNDLQEKRNALLDRAIALLATQLRVQPTASPDSDDPEPGTWDYFDAVTSKGG